MKELSIEEKAKAYEEKLDVARHIYADQSVNDEDKYYIEVIFPELKVSDDERIRKALMDMFNISGSWHGFDYKDILAWLEKQGEQKPAWSEEDVHALNTLSAMVANNRLLAKEEIFKLLDWLKSLRPQPQPKQEWSEEDEEILYSIINDIEIRSGRITLAELKESYTKQIDWLKSLRPQNYWKPSEEQMKALNIAMCGVDDPLFSLYQDLLKLKA